jgi:hypothetical protein
VALFVFTKTGGVLGYPNSGTWSVPAYADGWSGQWYENGDEIMFYGVADGTYIFSWKGMVSAPGKLAGRQVEFYIDGSTDTAGTFVGTRTSSCADAPRFDGSDPAKVAAP